MSNEYAAQGSLQLGGGAQFWAYISPQNNTAKVVTNWAVQFQQGNWTGTITSANPRQILQTPNLSGIFNVTVTGSGPNFPPMKFTAQSGCNANIGCNSNCASMVAIIATPDGRSASYCTTWDAICHLSHPIE
jgi:hypothetical protein